MHKRYTGKLYCFSPPVMLATFVIETTFIFYVLWRYKMTAITRLVVAILACLAIFQAAEYMVCGGIGLQAGTWSRIGYGAITLLPPLGLHLAYKIAGRTNKYLITAAYATASAFVVYYVIITGAISGQTCYANYSVFDTHQASTFLYGLYYYGWLLTTVVVSLLFASQHKKHTGALRALALGYAAFIVPTTAINLVDPSTIAGIPSIMCGFAILLAFALVGRVAPEAIQNKENNAKLRRLFKI